MKNYVTQLRSFTRVLTFICGSAFITPLAYALDNMNSDQVTIASQKVSINNANIDQLIQLKGVGTKKAQAIIEYRMANGQFKSIDELTNVKGLGAKFIADNKALLSI